MSEDNVIKFPVKHRNEQVPPTPETVLINIMSMKEEDIAFTSELIFSSILDTLSAAGFYAEEDPENMKDLFLLLETVRSLIAKEYGVEHPFQELADKSFTFIDETRMKFNNPNFKFVPDDEHVDLEGGV